MPQVNEISWFNMGFTFGFLLFSLMYSIMYFSFSGSDLVKSLNLTLFSFEFLI